MVCRHTDLAVALAERGRDREARGHFEVALAFDPNDRVAHHGLAMLLVRAGELAAAEQHNQRAYAGCTPFAHASDLPLLVLESARGGNLPTDPFLDHRFSHAFLVLELFDLKAILPPHALVLNAVSDADQASAALARADQLLRGTQAPIINPPRTVATTGRVAVAERLRAICGVRTPQISCVDKSEVHPSDCPFLVRAPGFNTGEHFVKVDAPDHLRAALASLPGERVLLIEYIDTLGHDANFRKYRVLFINGGLYPLHLAVSPHWKIHYFSADMNNRADFRAEDESFLNDMPATLGPRAMRALAEIAATLGLDYGGIDFTLDAAGNVVVFEANASMRIVPPAPGARWDYRRAPVARALTAVQQMLLDRADKRRPDNLSHHRQSAPRRSK